MQLSETQNPEPKRPKWGSLECHQAQSLQSQHILSQSPSVEPGRTVDCSHESSPPWVSLFLLASLIKRECV